MAYRRVVGCLSRIRRARDSKLATKSTRFVRAFGHEQLVGRESVRSARAGTTKQNEREAREKQRSATCQDRIGDLQIMRLTLYQLSQRSFNTIRRIFLQHQIHPPWLIHTCLDSMRAPERPFRCFGYLFRQRGSRHGLFLEKDVIPPDRRRCPSGATRSFTVVSFAHYAFCHSHQRLLC